MVMASKKVKKVDEVKEKGSRRNSKHLKDKEEKDHTNAEWIKNKDEDILEIEYGELKEIFNILLNRVLNNEVKPLVDENLERIDLQARLMFVAGCLEDFRFHVSDVRSTSVFLTDFTERFKGALEACIKDIIDDTPRRLDEARNLK